MATESQNTKRDIENPVPGGVWAVGNSRIMILNRVVREDYTHTERRTSEHVWKEIKEPAMQLFDIEIIQAKGIGEN